MIELRNRPAVEELYTKYCARKSNISAHLPMLRQLAGECQDVAELGVERGRSSTALLLGCSGTLHSWDINRWSEASLLETYAGRKWVYTIGNSNQATLPDVDGLWIDAGHNYDEVMGDLAHHGKVRRWIALHDVETFRGQGMRWTPGGTRKPQIDPGLRGVGEAFDDFLERHQDTWRLALYLKNSHGFAVIRRVT